MNAIWTRRKVLQSATALALVPLLPRAARAALPDLTGATMGTRYRVRIERAPAGIYLPKLKRAIAGVLETTERLMSTYRPDSELSRFNASPETCWQPLSAPTARVIKAALRVHRESGGAFDAAAAPLLDYWGFGALPEHHRAATPVPPELLRRTMEAGIELDRGRLRKRHKQAALTLNAIAKGDAVDGVAEVLEGARISDYLIEIGGEIRVHGQGPEGTWRVGIDAPRGGVSCVLGLDRQAVATSGDYVDYFIEAGKRYCHILDPRSGRPIDNGLSLVSVVADTAMEADAWATALMVMGPRAGLRYAARRAMAAYFLVPDGDRLVTSATAAFQRLRVDGGA